MTLIWYNGGLLWKDGALAGSVDCCCVDNVCPDCCVEFAGGTFNGDGDLVYSDSNGGNGLTVTITMPTKNKRWVCDGEQITVTWEVTGSLDPGTVTGGYTKFSPSWKFITASPGGYFSQLGIEYQGGLLEWETSEATEYSVTLEFEKCFNQNTLYLGGITVGVDLPEMSVYIDGDYCGVDCCPVDEPCEDCCFVLQRPVGLDYNDAVWYFDEYDGYTMTVRADKRKVCLDEQIAFTVNIVPPRREDTYQPDLRADHIGWTRTDQDPEPSGIDGVGAEDYIEWGDLQETEYSFSLLYECKYSTEDGTLIVPDDQITVTTQNIATPLTVLIGLTDCGQTNCCPEPECCCLLSDPPCTASASVGLSSIGLIFSTTATPVLSYVDGCPIWNATKSGTNNDAFGTPHTWTITWTLTCEMVDDGMGGTQPRAVLTMRLIVDGGATADVTGTSNAAAEDPCSDIKIVSITGMTNFSGGYDPC